MRSPAARPSKEKKRPRGGKRHKRHRVWREGKKKMVCEPAEGGVSGAKNGRGGSKATPNSSDSVVE